MSLNSSEVIIIKDLTFRFLSLCLGAWLEFECVAYSRAQKFPVYCELWIIKNMLSFVGFFGWNIVKPERLISIFNMWALLNLRIDAWSLHYSYPCRLWPLRDIEDELNKSVSLNKMEIIVLGLEIHNTKNLASGLRSTKQNHIVRSS